jgi:Zn-dependent protease with chaperone function
MPAYTSLLTALGWSLMDSIWQMAVLWTVYYILTAGNKRFSAAFKHNLILLFVFFGSEWFVYTFIQLSKEPANSFGLGFIPISTSANRWVPYLSTFYLFILIARLIQFGFHYYGFRKNKSVKSLLPALQSLADRHARLMGITRRVSVYLSDLAETAETSRFFKPLILLPVSLLTRLTPQQVEAILVHELLHIRRNDYLVNICISCFRSIFFFNPFAHLFYRALATERELACDDGVIEKGYEPSLYAEALFSLEKIRQVQPGFSMAADGNRPWLLMERIRRLLGKPPPPKKRFNPLLYFALLTAFVLFGLQQKNSTTEAAVPVTANQVPVIPVRYEMSKVEIKEPVIKMAVKSPIHYKINKKNAAPEIQHLPDPGMIPAEETKSLEQAFFAENNIVRNYSNQQSAGLTQDPVPVFPGTPYIPSESLSYEALPEVMAADSLHDILVQKGIKDIIVQSRIKITASLKELETEIEKNRKQLKEIEIKNRNLILSDQKNLKPILEKIHLQLKDKKKEIEQLRIRLQVSDEEIIHI